jgi:CheY-like chemotaxis protein
MRHTFPQSSVFNRVPAYPDRELRVLLADDDDVLRDSLASLLTRRGYQTREATNGQEVLEWLSVSRELGLAPPDVLVLDVRMPCLSGVSLLTELRRAGWHLPVVLMTAHVDEEVSDAAIVWGAAAVLEKPFSAEALETVLANMNWLSDRARSGPTMALEGVA